MLSLEEFKKHLPDPNMPDQEAQKLKAHMEAWADFLWDVYWEDKKSGKLDKMRKDM